MKFMIKLPFLFILLLLKLIYCPPVPNVEKNDELDDEVEKLLGSIAYGDYLTQVMKELQNEKSFNDHVQKANNSADISDGLQLVSINVRSKLDELKRLEIIRLNKLQKEMDKRKSDDYHPLEMPIPPTKSIDISHLDDISPGSFNENDLKRLIDRTTQIIEKIDDRNDIQYKKHEMEKEAKKRAEIQSKITDEKQRLDEEHKWQKEERMKHAAHKSINEPASLEQLKTVWKFDDHMNDDSFNPRTFFFMHDINGDGNLDIGELETLMQRELDKAYDPNDNATDWVERYHETSRMRKKFLQHVDLDKNYLVSLEEFMKWMSNDQSKTDHEWKTQEEMEPKYSTDEFDEFYKDYLSRHPDLYQPPSPPLSTPIPPGNPTA